MKRQKFARPGRGDGTDYRDTEVGRNPGASVPSDRQNPIDDGSSAGSGFNGSSSYNNSFTRPQGGYYWNSFGHQGYFSSDNPYYQQLYGNPNEADSSALYERAVEWEADRANQLEQRDYAQQVLDEQRAYDDPSAQVARQRSAGINPDLAGVSSAGGVSSGSSAQMNQPAIADQTGQSKFSNYYDNKQIEIAEEQNELAKVQTVFQGISAAGSFIGGLSGGISNIMNAVSNMRRVSSEIALNEANSALGGAKANEIQALLAGKKKGQSLSNIGQGISNATATLSQLAQFSELIAPDTEDMTPHLQSLGIDDTLIQPYTDIIRQMHANPEMRAKYASANVKAKWSEAEDARYTQNVVDEMTDLMYRTEYEQKYWNYNTATLKSKIAELLNTSSYAQQVASNEMDSALLQGQSIQLSHDEMKLKADQLSYDTQIFLDSIVTRSQTLDSIDKSIDALYKQPKTPERDSQINRLQAEKISLRNMLSSQFYQIKESYLVTAQQIYQNQRFLNEDNTIKDEGSRSKYTFFSDATFNDLIHHGRTAGQIANEWTNTAISAFSTVSGFIPNPSRVVR